MLLYIFLLWLLSNFGVGDTFWWVRHRQEKRWTIYLFHWPIILIIPMIIVFEALMLIYYFNGTLTEITFALPMIFVNLLLAADLFLGMRPSSVEIQNGRVYICYLCLKVPSKFLIDHEKNGIFRIRQYLFLNLQPPEKVCELMKKEIDPSLWGTFYLSDD